MRKLVSGLVIGSLVLSLSVPVLASGNTTANATTSTVTTTATGGTTNTVATTTTADAGILPDSPFYFLKVLVEKVELVLTFNQSAKAKLLAQLAEERLAEANLMLQANKPELAARVAQQFVSMVQDAQRIALSAQARGVDVSQITLKAKSEQQAAAQVLAQIIAKMPATQETSRVRQDLATAVVEAHAALKAVKKQQQGSDKQDSQGNPWSADAIAKLAAAVDQIFAQGATSPAPATVSNSTPTNTGTASGTTATPSASASTQQVVTLMLQEGFSPRKILSIAAVGAQAKLGSLAETYAAMQGQGLGGLEKALGLRADAKAGIEARVQASLTGLQGVLGIGDEKKGEQSESKEAAAKEQEKQSETAKKSESEHDKSQEHKDKEKETETDHSKDKGSEDQGD